jgi:predicted nucleotidyltransferase
MPDLLARCSFPVLSQPYDQALQEAVVLILSRYSPVGIVAAGSILRGQPDRTSDLDIYVIHQATYRQRLQKYFHGVPAEIFINPPHQMLRYFVEEHADGRPITAHMLANGFLVLSTDDIVDQLRQQAKDWLAKTPVWSETQLLWSRYMIGNQYEDGMDLIERDPAMAQAFLSKAVVSMLEYYFHAHSLFLPRSKEMIEQVEEHDAVLGAAARSFFTSENFIERVKLAEQIADATIGVHGFFEWETSPEELPPA